MIYFLLLIIFFLLTYICLYKRYVHKLLSQAQDALDNGDYSFCLPEVKKKIADKQVICSINAIIRHARIECYGQEELAWERLIRLFTHEVMNGMAPISSLSEILIKDSLIRESHLYDAVKAINDTSNGLMKFVKSYRKYIAEHDLTLETFSISEILNDIKNIVSIPDDVKLNVMSDMYESVIYADKNLLRQVLLNILKNASEAVMRDEQGKPYQNTPMIQVYAYQYSDTLLRIRVSNNGQVIPDEIRENIFTPFFTTKRDGSGIGLPLCRQLLRHFNATIILLPTGAYGWNTSFIIELPTLKNK